MKKIIASLFSLFYPDSEDNSEDEKTPVWKMALILIFIGLVFLVVYLI